LGDRKELEGYHACKKLCVGLFVVTI